MSHRPARPLLLLLTILALVMPRVSGAVASVTPGVMTYVICTGQGMVTVRVDANGNPVSVVDQPDHCLLSHAIDTSARVVLTPLILPIVDTLTRPTGGLVRAAGYTAARPPPRAPPAI